MGKIILVVDDDESVRKSISAALRMKGGYEVFEAEDGFGGLELAKQHRPDLIISDVVMKNLNGFLMLEVLKEYPGTSNIPIIMMTQEAQTDREWKMGAAIDYISKGFTLDFLLEKVHSILNVKPESKTST
ncbi:MAG: response regulator [Ignavibacteriae bacterium]|nr:MAG: response regulator [Ignavibacteriota bacterium]